MSSDFAFRLSQSALDEAVAAVRARTGRVPEVALILGSGLGGLADAASDAVSIPTADVPGYPPATVAGHAGRLVIGRLEGRDVAFVQGRAHFYEGHSIGATVFPVRLLHALGARRLLVTNAAGGINPGFAPGTLMFITDHLNLAFRNPLAGAGRVSPGSPRGSLDAAVPYDPDWLDRAEAVALRRGIATRRGVYVWTTGPSYEAKAEIRMFARLGADVVGMSTVPEVLQARALGLPVLGLSAITNPAAGLGKGLLHHDEVLEMGRRLRGDLERLVRGILAET